MFFIGFLVGLILGFLLKLGFDEYHKFKTEQEITAEQMKDILSNFKALEKMKELEKINEKKL